MLYAVIGIIVLLILAVIVMYNMLIQLKVKVEEGWADIDTQLKRRYDLIPNLIETVKGYASHESETFEKVTKARTEAISAGTPEEQAKAENFLTQTLKSLFALSENYPDLKANENFMQLQNTLNEIEEAIQLSRRYYNGTVRDFNTKVQTIPYNLITGLGDFGQRQFFELDDEAQREAPKVSFDK